MSRNINRKKKYQDIAPEDIFLDAHNIPKFDKDQLEGRIERPLHQRAIIGFLIIAGLVGFIFAGRLWYLQVMEGGTYLAASEENRLDRTVLFARRGEIVDRGGVLLVGNTFPATTTEDIDPAEVYEYRDYIDAPGFAHLLGYVAYPKKDSDGFYFQEHIEGREGVEHFYNTLLKGENGSKLVEETAVGETVSESVVDNPEDGENLQLAIDSRIQEKLHEAIAALAEDVGFVGGAGVIMDVANGEILALTSYPEYDPQIITEGENDERIAEWSSDERNPFLNRVTSGLYTPGSIIKPYVAAGALDRGIIDPEKEIYSSGELVVPNPYDPERPTIFKDWKAHGLVNMWEALAVSSNVYFFQIGGGFENQRGIGISGIEEYAREFGIAEETDIDLPAEAGGVIPNPDWKEENFGGDPWRVGDTYNTSIGQYGFQVTPLQMTRAVASIANGGVLVEPHVRLKSNTAHQGKVDVDARSLRIVREGMRRAVEEGTAKGLNTSYVDIAAKTGTAELGSTKSQVNSWVTGFFPYENPRYAFAVVMEEGPATNVLGGVYVMRQLFDWMSVNAPEYFE